MQDEDARNAPHGAPDPGVNGAVAHMIEDRVIGSAAVVSLRRVRFGPVDLGEQPQGTVRPLTAEEVAALKREAGLE
jgi:16S rRNA U516 pseudouridylate synthase RsuA-like enzyme